jgi:membrane protease YdiL (CAAX protease family)
LVRFCLSDRRNVRKPGEILEDEYKRISESLPKNDPLSIRELQQVVKSEINCLNTNEFRNRSMKLSSPWAYFLFTFILSWSFTIPIALTGKSLEQSPALMVLYALGGLGPAISAVLLVYLTQNKWRQRDYLRRIVDFRRIPPLWYGVILLTVPAITALAALIDRLFGGPGIRLEEAARLLAEPLALFPFTLFILFFGPLPEEIGWRGYALDRLQSRLNALNSSFILGGLWAIWHLPQFFIRGTYQHDLGFGLPPSFWTFAVTIVCQSLLYTWIYNNTRRSTLSAILFHFMTNFVGELFELSQRAEWFALILWILTAIFVGMIWEYRTLPEKIPEDDI